MLFRKRMDTFIVQALCDFWEETGQVTFVAVDFLIRTHRKESSRQGLGNFTLILDFRMEFSLAENGNLTSAVFKGFSLNSSSQFLPVHLIFPRGRVLLKSIDFPHIQSSQSALAQALFPGFTKEGQGGCVDAMHVTEAILLGRRHLELLVFLQKAYCAKL